MARQAKVVGQEADVDGGTTGWRPSFEDSFKKVRCGETSEGRCGGVRSRGRV